VSSSQASRRVHELPGDPEVLRGASRERLHAQDLGRVVSGVNDHETCVVRLDGRVVRSLPHYQRVDADLQRLSDSLA